MSLRKYRLSAGVESVHSVIPGMQMEKFVREGAQIMLGSNESYVALCRKHYKEGNYGKKLEQKMKRAPGGTVKLWKKSKI